MCLVSLASSSWLSLAGSGAIASKHGHAATASGGVGFSQIGSASPVAMGVSAVFGTGAGHQRGPACVPPRESAGGARDSGQADFWTRPSSGARDLVSR